MRIKFLNKIPILSKIWQFSTIFAVIRKIKMKKYYFSFLKYIRK